MEDAGKGQEEEATLEGERNSSINEIFVQKSQTFFFFFFKTAVIPVVNEERISFLKIQHFHCSDKM